MPVIDIRAGEEVSICSQSWWLIIWAKYNKSSLNLNDLVKFSVKLFMWKIIWLRLIPYHKVKILYKKRFMCKLKLRLDVES